MNRSAASPVVEISALVKRFGAGSERPAIDDLTAQIRPGCVTGIVGPDGAGKTTLLRLIAGLLVADDGRLRVLGLDPASDVHALHRRIGYMPQRFGLYEDLTVDENLSLYADLQGLAAETREQRFADLLRFTGMAPFGARLAGRLSGGMKQKLGLACTLIRPPEVLLLDEPSVGVDPVSRRELWEIVYSLVDHGTAVLWSTAYLDEAERCRDVLLLDRGRLLRHGEPAEFTEKVRGRVFSFSLGKSGKRRAQQQARLLPGVMDAEIQGHVLRLLLAPGAAVPSMIGFDGALQGQAPELTASEPRFEDAFVDILRGAEPSAKAIVPEKRIRPVADSAEAPIRVDNLQRVFGDFHAVDGISFEVQRGEIFGLLGPNGAGKSTTFKMLCGLLPPSAGNALVLGIDLRQAAARARARIGYMSQKFALYGSLSVAQNLRFFASAYDLSGPRRQQRIEAELRDFDLGSLADQVSGELPLGYKQRLSLACAIMHDPDIVFLDEPTSGVDPLTRREFWGRINAMADDGVTVLVTTHFMDEAEYCDRLGIIYRGKLIALGSPEHLRKEHPPAPGETSSLEQAFVALIEGYDAQGES